MRERRKSPEFSVFPGGGQPVKVGGLPQEAFPRRGELQALPASQASGSAGNGRAQARPSDSARDSGSSVSGVEEVPINILIVDDEPKNLTVLESVLDNPGYRLVRATSADEALLALIVDEFALLILDISMPGMTGFELAQAVKERKKTAHVPIIFLTAYYNEDEHVLEGYETGAVDYLRKPVNAAVLRSKVSVFAQLHRRNREIAMANRALVAEVEKRQRIEDQLRDLNETLEQRVAERTNALREKQLRLRYAADAARLTFVEVDFPGGGVQIAENFAAVMGYVSQPAEEVNFSRLAEVLLSHVEPQDRAPLKLALDEFGAGKAVSRLDYRVMGNDGMERWIETEWFLDSDSDGTPVRGFLTNLDITGRKAAQKQLTETEERFRQLADSMPQMVWTAHSDGRLDYFNARWHQFAGSGTEQFGDFESWAPLLHRDDLKQATAAWDAALESGKEYRAEFRLWDRRTSRYGWYLGRALPVRDADGAIAKWFGTCTDIDEQKRTEEDLRRSNQALEHFAFAASHDLQEPLRNVAIYAQLLEKRYGAKLGDEAETFLQIVVEGAQRMGNLVSGLLAYTQTASFDPDETAAGVVDAGRIMEQVLRGLEGSMREIQATVTYDTLPAVAIKELHLEQLLQNLIGNALKYRKDDEPPRVHVSAVEQAGKLRFAVQDNGIGIAPEYKDHVFGVFKRLHAQGGKYSGTGIGLAICQKIVERNGGRIWVESEAGNGATFYFTIPVLRGI
jgi:PAS domain S-box-containing protein